MGYEAERDEIGDRYARARLRPSGGWNGIESWAVRNVRTQLAEEQRTMAERGAPNWRGVVMKHLERSVDSLDACLGKTIAAAFHPNSGRHDDEEWRIFLVFTDGTHVQLRATSSYDEPIIDVDPTTIGDVDDLQPAQLEALGLTETVRAHKSRVEAQRREEQQQRAINDDQHERAEYERLRRKYEPR